MHNGSNLFMLIDCKKNKSQQIRSCIELLGMNIPMSKSLNSGMGV